ncbi:methyltransferase [Cytophagales bacterium WSM2-2]|nr:methyltransferase [Cytophagales bacterium WSM2-2]
MQKNSFDSLFDFENGVFFQKGLLRNSAFENVYLELRDKETRNYTDDLVGHLPSLSGNHPNRKEWRVRTHSSSKLVNYLKAKKEVNTILELGCGNGWLSNYLAKSFSSVSVFAMDVNQTELLQGSRVFGDQSNLKFYYADILTCPFPGKTFDVIVLAASAPYFPSLAKLCSRLLEILTDSGEIHLIDSPIYHSHEIEKSKQRSIWYFSESGFPQMQHWYHYHDWYSLNQFHYSILNPPTIWSRLERFVRGTSPFPWVKITKTLT